MAINPLSACKNLIVKNESKVNQETQDYGFEKALNDSINAKAGRSLNFEEMNFLKELSDNLPERIEYYQSISENEDHETYIEMMKYFKENQV